MASRIHIPRAGIADFCQRHRILKLSLFGSVLREEFRSDSDIDVLVEFDPHHVPGFFELARLERELSMVLGNRKVDIRTPQDLSRHFRDEVLAAAEVQYVAG